MENTVDTNELIKYAKNFNVLYMEDEDLLRISTKEMLENYFNKVDVAADGETGTQKYKKYYEQNNKFYDIVIIDLIMPKMNGEEVSNFIIDFNPNQNIIALSAKADFEQIVRLINLGVNKFILKPIATQELKTVIYDVALDIRIRLLKEEEQKKITEYNKILKIREDASLEKLQKKMKELEAFDSALNSSAIISKTDTQGIINYVNDEFCDVCGYSKEELVGHGCNMLNSGNRSKSFYTKLWNTINSKKIYKTIFQNRRKDGSIYYIKTVINPILDINGDILEFIAVSHDMTQLIKSLETTKKAKKSKEEFFVNISHEMRTPLNSILGFSSILKKRIKDDEKSSMMVDKIFETGHELQKLVESILDMRKIKENTFTLKESIFNPAELLTLSIEKYTKLSKNKSQNLKMSLDYKLPLSLIGDSSRIIQVLNIVLDNAVKFTPTGGKINVSVFYNTSNEILTCEVQDSGIGISKENQKKIFEFNQLDASTCRLYEGAGIGLSVASGIIKAMHGQISLKSIPEMGSLFKIEFPLKQY